MELFWCSSGGTNVRSIVLGGKDVYLGVLPYQLGTTMVDVTDLEHTFLLCPIFIPGQLFIIRQEVMGLVPAELLD